MIEVIESKPSELAIRTTIGMMVAERDALLGNYTVCSQKLQDAYSAISRCYSNSSHQNQYNQHVERLREEIGLKLIRVNPDVFLTTARRIVDTDAWAKLMQMDEISSVLDHTAKSQLRQTLLDNPPEFSEDNVRNTLANLVSTAGDMFRRGIATCFSKLDKRFMSHDGWKIGSRVILFGAFNDWGGWCWTRNYAEIVTDVERVILKINQKIDPSAPKIASSKALDANDTETFKGIVGLIDKARKSMRGIQQTFVENEFFKVRIYMNGNLHLWFKNDDDIDMINRLLGEYYEGIVIPEDRTRDRKYDHLPKMSLAKNLGYYPTPEKLVNTIMKNDDLETWLYQFKKSPRVLEPSAGDGALVKGIVGKCSAARVTCVEIDPTRAESLRGLDGVEKVYGVDFLLLEPETLGKFDLIIMNPPFDRERDIDHVTHAVKFLAEDGVLISIMSAGTMVRETKKSVAFRERFTRRGSIRELPAGSFASVGTNVNTCVLSTHKGYIK